MLYFNFTPFSLSKFLKPIVLVVIVVIFVAVTMMILRLKFTAFKNNLTYSDLLMLKDDDFVIIDIGGFKIKAEIARSNTKREQGLSGREKLKDNEGMLFIFEQEGNYGFWMKGMLFDIDIIFIKDNNIVDIAENMPYPQNDNTIAGVSPKEKANLVLEVNSGFVKRYNIKIGNKVVFLKSF